MEVQQYRRLLSRFLTAKQAANRSATTVAWYERQISAFLLWLDAPELMADELPALIDEFLASERQRGVKPSTVAARYRALSAWLNWCARRHLIERNPIPELDKPSVPKEQARYVTLDECNALLESIAGNAWRDHRDRLILTLLFWSGLRAAELTNLNVSDIDARAGTLLVRRGKGGKARVVPMAPPAAAHLVAYIYSRPAYDGPELLLSGGRSGSQRGALTTAGLRMVLRARCESAQMPYLHPHAWRHGFAMILLNGGADLSAVSAMMGHSNTAVTQAVYASWQTRGLLREYGEALSRIQA
jgi:site-specific recombinase XerD